MPTLLQTKTNSLLDHRFAWRWLLPLQANARLVLCGLAHDEQHWWQERFILADEDQPADGLLIALESLSAEQLTEALTVHSARWLCAWGSGNQIASLAGELRHFASVRCYGLLPAAVPRVVVPLSAPTAATAGLRLHRPGRFVARLALQLASVLARLGIYWPLKKKVLLIACSEANPLPVGAAQAGFNVTSAPADFALYLGTPEADRKTVALPIPPSDTACIVKAGNNPQACAALRKEAAALAAMNRTTLDQQVPVLLAYREGDAQASLVQAYRQRVAVGSKKQTQAVKDFLRTLATIENQQTTLADCVCTLPETLLPAMDNLRRKLAAMALDTPVTLHRSHGDFAPWNCAWTQQGLFVFDWEASQADGLALSDAFYYVLGPLLLVEQCRDGRLALEAVGAFIAPLLQKMGVNQTDWQLYLALWLLTHANPPELYCNTAAALLEEWQ